MSDKLTTKDFAAKIKSKYPQYENVEDTVLVESILSKYPEYSERVDFKKKEESLPESTGTSLPSDSEVQSTEIQEPEVPSLTKEQELAEARRIAEADASKGFWENLSDMAVEGYAGVQYGLANLLGLEQQKGLYKSALEKEAEKKENIKKANQVVQNDIIANPESSLEQYNFLTEQINQIEQEQQGEIVYENKQPVVRPNELDKETEAKLKELKARRDVMAPAIKTIEDANWFKTNVLDATEETAIYQPTGSIEDADTGEDLGVVEGTEDDVYLATYKKFLQDTNPKALEEHNEKVNTLKGRGSVELLEDAESRFEIEANNWYNQQINNSASVFKSKKRVDENGNEYTFQDKINESEVLRNETSSLEKELVELDDQIKEKINNSKSASKEIKLAMQNDFDTQADEIVRSYQAMADKATTQDELDSINNMLKSDIAKLEIDVTAKYSSKFSDIQQEIESLNRQRANKYGNYKTTVDKFNNIVSSDDFQEYSGIIGQYENVFQNTETILQKYPTALAKKQEVEDRQIYLDRARRGELEGDIDKYLEGQSKIPYLFSAVNRKASQLAENILTLGRTFTAGGEYGFLEQLGDYVEYSLEDNQVQSSPEERALVEKVVLFGDHRLTLDDEGNPIDVRDKDGFKIRNTATVKNVIADYMETPESERPQEITDINNNILFTKFVDTSVDMAQLIYGGQFATKGLSMVSKFSKINKAVGLTTSGIVFQHNGLYNEAIDAGMSKDNAGKFAMAGATILGALENVSPGDAIFDKALKRKIVKDYVKILAKGKTTKGDIAKVIARNVSSEIVKENIQEISQTVADRAVKAATNQILDNDYFDTQISKEELLETAILTTMSTGSLAGFTQAKTQRVSTLESNALYSAVKDKDQAKMFQKLDSMVEEGSIDQDAASRTKDLIVEGKNLFSQIPEGKYNEAMQSQILTLQLLKNKALKEKSSADNIFGKQYDTTVKEIDREINSIINSKSPKLFFKERVENLNVETAPRLSKLNQDYVSGKITQEQYDSNLKSIVNPSNGVVIDALQKFGEKVGRPFSKKQPINPINVQKAIAISDAFEAMQNDPINPEVKQAYDAFKKETKEQFEYLKSLGYKFIPQKGNNNAYETSKEMSEDVANNKSLRFLPTENEISFGDQSIDNPMLEKTGVVIDGYELSFNDMFRITHDMSSHVAYGHKFGPLGEMNAYDAHSKTYSPTAQRALFTETMGHHSYNNYGSHLRNEDGTISKENQKGFVPLSMRPYAPQKTGLLPVELMTEKTQEQERLDMPYQDLVLNDVDVKLDEILAKAENGEQLNEQEIDDAKKYLSQIFDDVVNSNITLQGKEIVLQHLELVENQIDNYENIVTTKTVTVVETKTGTYAERGAIKKKVSEYSKQVRPARERLVGRIVQVEGLELPEGSVAVLNQDNDGVFIEVVDKETGTRSQRIDLGTNNPNEISIENVEMDEFDRPSSVQLKFGDTNMTVIDPVLVMDLAIEKHEEVNPIYEQDVETIKYGIETVTEQDINEKVEKTEEEVRIEEENKTDIQKIEEQIEMSALSNKSLKGKALRNLANRLQSAFPNVPIKLITSKQAKSILPNQNVGKAKGFAYGGGVYIVTDNVTMDTPIHEMAHIFNSYAKKYEPELYRKGLELVKGTKYEEGVRNNPNYSNLDEEGILEEALTQAIGEKGALLEQEKRKGFQAWLKNLFDIIRSKGIPVNLTLGQYTDFIAGRLLSGDKISEITPEELNEIDSNPKLKALFSFVYDNNLDPNNGAVVASRILESLREAKEYSKLGEDRIKIAKLTGWSQGPDGFWRFEVSDSDLKFNKEQKAELIDSFELFFAKGNKELLDYSMDISSLFDGNILAEFYPELKNFGVDFDTFDDNPKAKGAVSTIMPNHMLDVINLLENESLEISDKDRSTLIDFFDDYIKLENIKSPNNNIRINPLVSSGKYKSMYIATLFSQEVAEVRQLVKEKDYASISRKTEIYKRIEEIENKITKTHSFLSDDFFVLTYMAEDPNSAISEKNKAYAEAELMMMEGEAATVQERKDLFYNNLFEQIKSTFLHEQQHVAQAIASVSKGGSISDAYKFDTQLKELLDKGTISEEKRLQKMFESYQSLLGEQEARIVQERMNMTQEQLNEDITDFGGIKNAIIVSHAHHIIDSMAMLYDVSPDVSGKLIEFGLKQAQERIKPRFSFAPENPTEREGFNEWFKNSEAVNEDGNPQVYYHGTTRVFDTFDMGRNSQLVDAMFFSPDPEFANKYTEPTIEEKVKGDSVLPNIMPAYLSIQNPFDYDNPSHVKRLVNSLGRMDVDMFAISMSLEPGEFSRADLRRILTSDPSNNWLYLEPFGNNIKSLGYDSMYILEKGRKNVAIFDPNQAKSIYSKDYSTAKFSKPSQNDIKNLISNLVEQGFSKGQILEAFANKGYDLNDVNKAFDSLIKTSIKNEFVKEQEAPRQNKLVNANEDVSIWQGITNKLKNAADFFTNLFTPQGQLRKEVYSLIEEKGQNVKSMIANIQFNQRKLKRVLENIIEGPMTMDNPNYAEVIKDIEKALRGEISFDDLTNIYGLKVSESVSSMRNEIDSLSSQLIESGFTQDEIKLKMIDNLGSYLTRSYALYDDPAFSGKTGPEIREAFAKDPNKSAILNNAINYLRREQSGEIYERLMKFYEGELNRINQEYQSGQITKEEYEAQKSNIADIQSNKNGKLTEAFENELLNVVDNILNKEEVSFIGVTGALSSKDSKILKEKKEIAPEIRALMGEYNDPMYNYANTAMKVFSLIEQQKLLKKLKDVGMGDFIYSANDPNRPGDAVQIAAESNDALAPLNGMYMDPKVFAEIKGVTNPQQRGMLLQRLFDFVSWTRESKTTLSPMTHMRNVLGNLGFIMMNGHIGFTSPKAGGNSIRAVMYDLNILDSKMAKLLGAKKIVTEQDRQQVEELIKKLTALGVIRQNVSVNDIIDLSQNGDFDYYFSKNMDGYQSNENTRLSMMISKGKKGIDIGRKKAQDLYQAEDDMFKIYAFAMERSRYESALRKKGMTETEIDDFVAERVKNTYPTYSRVGKAVEYIRRVPFLGDFLSFKYESIRTLKNSILIAKSDMMDPDLRVEGAKRMASTIGYLGVKTAAFKLIGGFASNAFLGLFGGEDEDEKKKILACRKFLPEYDEFGALSITKINRDGTFEYTNFGAVDPHSDLEEVLTSIDLLSDPDYGDESLAIAISKSIGNYIGSYLGLSMGTEATLQIRDILLDPNLTDDAKYSKILSEMDVLLPGFVTQIDKVASSEDKIKTMKSMLTGVRESKSDPKFKIRRELSNLSGKISSEKSLFYKDKNAEQYRSSINNINEEVAYVKDLIDSARMLGVPNSEIKKMINNPKILLPKQVRRELYVGYSTGIWFNY